MFVEQDWFELFVAQDFVLDGLLYPLVFQTIVDGDLAQRGGAAVAMMTQFQNEWAAETRKWVDAQIKAACADDAGNAALIGRWIAKWTPRAAAAPCPLAALGLGARTPAASEIGNTRGG